MTDDGKPQILPGLAQLLIEQKIISQAQADIAVNDQEMTGMTFDEVLLVRGWVSKEKLYEVAPWLNAPANPSRDLAELSTSIGSTYQENLKVYRRLIEKILGKGWE